MQGKNDQNYKAFCELNEYAAKSAMQHIYCVAGCKR